MRKLSIKNLSDFRSKSEKSKKMFASSLQKERAEKSGTGGDYWVSCLSAIARAFKVDDLQLIVDKIDELDARRKEAEHNITKDMHQRNINILRGFEKYDFKKLRPSKAIEFKNKRTGLLSFKGFDIKVRPQHVFTFGKEGEIEIGAVWFVAKLGGYKTEDLGMFTDILFSYLKAGYPNYSINAKYCIAIDVTKISHVTYLQIESGKVHAVLVSTLNDLKKFL
jgi:hypothetical protein